MKLDYLERVLDSEGTITLGNVRLRHCVAIASDSHDWIATLVRKRNESLAALLRRLDAAVASAWEDGAVIDEIND